MAYSQTLELVQGDRLPQLTVTLRDSNTAAPGKVLDPDDPATWAVIDLTGGSVNMYVRFVGQTDIKDTLIGILSSPAEGKATFLFSERTLDTPGTLEAEIEFTDSTGRTQTVNELIRLKVRPQF